MVDFNVEGPKINLPALPSMASISSSSSSTDISLPHRTVDIDYTRWNSLYDYCFSMQLADTNGDVVINSADTDIIKNSANQVLGKFSAVKVPYIALRIPPSAISVNIPFSNTVTATNRGVIEENNGVVFRNIDISGTTGIYPDRLTLGQTSNLATNIINGLFPSLLPSVGAIAKTVTSIGNSLFGGSPNVPTLSGQSSDSIQTLQETGYYKFWELHNFFIKYAETKKRQDASGLRLLFSSPKDNISYICTPVSFDLKRDAINPLLYRYLIRLKCWDIVTASSKLTQSFQIASPKNLPSIGQLLNTIRLARTAIAQSNALLKGVQNDIGNIFQVVSQSILFLDDVVGLGHDLIDFGPTLKNNVNLLITNSNQQLSQLHSSLGSLVSDYHNLLNQGLNYSPSSPAPTGETQEQSNVVSSTIKSKVQAVLNDPNVTSNAKLSALGTLPTAVQKQINQQIADAQNISATQVQTLSDKLLQVSNNLAYQMGTMDAQFAETYGLPVPTTTTTDPSEDEILLAVQLNDAREAYLNTLASGDIYQKSIVNPFTDANQVLDANSQLPTPFSGYPVIFSKGNSLEKLAQQYLGDANQAVEIILLNSLRSPYIDEDGFMVPITQALGITFNTKTIENLEIGQIIHINGTGVVSSRRKIINIENIDGTNFKITVDGDPTLSVFSSSTSPNLTARLPGTIGSGDTILIPSPDQPDVQEETRSTPLLERLSYAEKTFGIDLALATSGDLQVGPTGDIERCYGYQNAAQALRILVETEKGELEQHPDYGIALGIGQKSPQALAKQLEDNIRASVTSDPRFSTASVNTLVEPNAVTVNIIAQGINGTGKIPIQFKAAI